MLSRFGCGSLGCGVGNEEADCPRCGRSTWQVHQWHAQRTHREEFYRG